MEAVLEQWFATKYRLPSNHPLFLGRSLTEHMEEFVRDKMDEKEILEAQLAAHDVENRLKILEQIGAIDRFLNDTEELPEGSSGDPLSDYWEAQMDAGLEPDFDMTLEDLKELQK